MALTRRVGPAGRDHLRVPAAVRWTAAGSLAVIQTRAAKREHRGQPRPFVALLHHLPRLGVNLAAAHSPTTLFRMSISSAFRPPQALQLRKAPVFIAFHRRGTRTDPALHSLDAFSLFLCDPMDFVN